MTKVRILHAGGVGEFKQGDVVDDAHAGLVEIATKGIRNVADGELVAELVDSEAVDEELAGLRQRATELGVKGNIGAMKKATLEAKVAEAEEAARTEELAALKEQAKGLNIEGADQMDADQLKDAIEKATQGGA